MKRLLFAVAIAAVAFCLVADPLAVHAMTHAAGDMGAPAALAMMAAPAVRGLVMPPRADANDPKAVLAELNKAWAEFKAANDKDIADLKKGLSDAVQTEKVDKISASITEMQAQLTDLALKAAAAEIGGGAGATDEAKSAQQFALERGVAVTQAEFKAYRDGLNVYLRRGDATPRDVRAAMSVGSDPDGGYTVTPDTSGRIIRRIYETSPMRQLASVATIGSDKIEGFNDLGEGVAGWVGETAPRPATDTPKIGKWDIPVFEMWAFPQVTQKLLDDSAWNIEQWLSEKTADKFARTENTAFLLGDGAGKPKGLLTYPTAATADATRPWGTFEHVLTGSDGSFGAAMNGSDKLIDLIYKVKAAYRSNARFLMSRATVAASRKLKDGQGNYLWQPSAQAGQPATLLGYGIAEGEDMPAVAADSLSIAFGDFAEAYQIVDRIGIRVLRDPFTNKPYIGFYTTKRVGGGAVSFEAVKFLKFGD